MPDEVYTITEETLEGIADAIRFKDGTSATIQVSDFASRIEAIPSGTTNYDELISQIIGDWSEE